MAFWRSDLQSALTCRIVAKMCVENSILAPLPSHVWRRLFIVTHFPKIWCGCLLQGFEWGNVATLVSTINLEKQQVETKSLGKGVPDPFSHDPVLHPRSFECALQRDADKLMKLPIEELKASVACGGSAMVNLVEFSVALGAVDCLRALVLILGDDWLLFPRSSVLWCATVGMGSAVDTLRFLLDEKSVPLDGEQDLNQIISLLGSCCEDSFDLIVKSAGWEKEFPPGVQTRVFARACAVGTVSVAERLIDRVDVNSDKGEDFPVVLAGRNGNFSCLCLLLERGADVNVRDQISLAPPLVLASCRGHVECVRLLLENGADVNLTNGDARTALLEAARTGNVDCVQALLEHGAKVNYCDIDGWSPLISAAQHGRTECVRLLLESGADAQMVHNGGKRALDEAVRGKHDECVALLEEYGY